MHADEEQRGYRKSAEYEHEIGALLEGFEGVTQDDAAKILEAEAV